MGYLKIMELKKAIDANGQILTIEQCAALVGDGWVNSPASAMDWVFGILRECSVIGTDFVFLPDERTVGNVTHQSNLRLVYLHRENEDIRYKLHLLLLLIEFGSSILTIADYARLTSDGEIVSNEDARKWLKKYRMAIKEFQIDFILIEPLPVTPDAYIGKIAINKVDPAPLSDVDGSKPGNSSRDNIDDLLRARNAKYGNSYYATDKAIMAMIEGDASNLQGLLDAGILANWVIIMSKMNRAIWSPNEPDHFRDIAGYCSLIAKILSGEPSGKI